MTTCYIPPVEKTRRSYRKLTDEERGRVVAAQARRRETARAADDALAATYATWRALYDLGVSPSSIAEAAGLHPTVVQKVCTPSPNYRAQRERK